MHCFISLTFWSHQTGVLTLPRDFRIPDFPIKLNKGTSLQYLETIWVQAKFPTAIVLQVNSKKFCHVNSKKFWPFVSLNTEQRIFPIIIQFWLKIPVNFDEIFRKVQCSAIFSAFISIEFNFFCYSVIAWNLYRNKTERKSCKNALGKNALYPFDISSIEQTQVTLSLYKPIFRWPLLCKLFNWWGAIGCCSGI